jgi:RNA ligase (TIGR02306 family)
MSEFKTCFTKIREIHPHPNPEVHSLEIAVLYDFRVIISKTKNYKVGDFLLYIPLDSIIPQDLEALIFPEGSKMKLSGSRVRQVKIQKVASQGLTVDVSVVKQYLSDKGLKLGLELKLEHDYKDMLGITKYEPPTPAYQSTGEKKTRTKPRDNSNFHKYNGLDNIKWFPDMFQAGEQVVIQEKLHGSNCRAGIVPTEANTTWKKIKKFFGMLPEYEQVYGSNNVELTNKANKNGYYGSDVYGAVLKRIKAFDKIVPGEIIYGELIGEGIQKNYTYGRQDHHFVLFDVKTQAGGESSRWLTPTEVESYARARGFDVVPTLYEGPYNKDLAYELTKGDSVYDPKQKVREGIVIKAKEYNNTAFSGNKKSLKWISEKYLEKDQSDFH